MARYKCPGCGKPFDGKRCRECYYEHFTEEIAHGLHVHEGEPLVVKGTQPRRPVRPTPANPGSCKPYPGRKKKAALPKWLAAVLVVIFFLLTELPLVEIVEDVADIWVMQDIGLATNEAVPESMPVLPERTDTTVLYEDGSLTVAADWQDGQKYQGDIPIYMQNHTGQDLAVYVDLLYVNGYLMEDASFYCQAQAGETALDYLWLDEDELTESGIETVAEITFRLCIYDTETYETYAQSAVLTFLCDVPDGFVQPVESSGQVLCDQDGVKVVYQGCEGTECQDAQLVFFVENTTDQVIELYTGEAYVNGSEADLFLWCDLLPGTRAVTRVQLYSLPDMGVETTEEIRSVELVLEWISGGDWDNWTQTDKLSVDVNG